MNIAKLKEAVVTMPLGLARSGHYYLAEMLSALLSRLVHKSHVIRIYHLVKALRLSAGMASRNGNEDFFVFVINRDTDRDRLAKFRKGCQKYCIQFERIAAVDAFREKNELREQEGVIADTFYGRDRFPIGSVGCFLSHKRAWERVAEEKHGALICEDDASFLTPLKSRWADYAFPEDADVVFANLRLAEGTFTAACHEVLLKSPTLPLALPFAEAVKMIEGQLTQFSAPGGDGYFVTRNGAKKILDIFSRTKLALEVDWFLFFYSLTTAERSDFIAHDVTGRFDRLMFVTDERLNSYILSPCVVEQGSGFQSTIEVSKPANQVKRFELFLD